MSNITLFDRAGGSPVPVLFGPVNEWHEPGCWDGYRESVPQAFATFEVTGIGDERTVGPTHLRDVARSVLASAAFMPGCDAVEIRYLATPTGPGAARVQMFITAKSSDPVGGPSLAAAAATAAASALPASYTSEAATVPWIGDGNFQPVFELRRIEEVTGPQWDYIPTEFYYYLTDRPGDGSGWGSLWRALASVDDEVVISLLFKQTDLHSMERHVLGAIASDLAIVSVSHMDVNLIGQEVLYPGCENARIALESWQERIVALQRPLVARIAVRGEPTTAMRIASTLAGAIAATTAPGLQSAPMYVDAPLHVSDVRAAAQGFDWLEVFPWGGAPLWQHESAPKTLRRTPYLFGLDEAAGLAVLPVPDEQGVPGFVRSRRIAPRRSTQSSSGSEPSVLLGDFINQGRRGDPALLPLTAINRHVLVAGTPGSGKTTTVLTLLASLWRDHGVPFMVIEPTKAEYRTLLRAPGMEALRLVCLGRDDIAPIRLNPLLPPPGVRTEVQANAVLAALKAALPLRDPLPELLGEAIDRAYRRAGWDYDTTADDGLTPPSLRMVMNSFSEAFEEQDYVGDARNVGPAMAVRLKSLLRGSKGRVLDTVESTDFAELFARPVVIELDEIADADDKAVMALFLLDRLRAWARANGSSEGRLRHVTVIEEAHRLLPRLAPSAGESGDTARAAGVEAFCNAIAELRSVGEGFVLSSQSPSRLAAAAVDNCGTRIMHRIESAADRDSVLADLDANELEREASARLQIGEAITRWPQLEEPEFIQVTPGIGVDSGAVVLAEDVKALMASESFEARQLLPYALCNREVCISGCEPTVRAQGEEVAETLARSAAKMWQEHQGAVDALDPIAAALRRESDGDTQIAYCGAAHLHAHGHALTVRRRVDIRSKIRDAIGGRGE